MYASLFSVNWIWGLMYAWLFSVTRTQLELESLKLESHGLWRWGLLFLGELFLEVMRFKSFKRPGVKRPGEGSLLNEVGFLKM
mmetsp:Transcript_63474/g.105593  ORF Transcript_63474/g.105593 Transcript_63474/m.105593 type:complete len:83 (+) Transcript_63474:220-468(+)